MCTLSTTRLSHLMDSGNMFWFVPTVLRLSLMSRADLNRRVDPLKSFIVDNNLPPVSR